MRIGQSYTVETVRSRNTFHPKEIEPFKAWMYRQGWDSVPPVGDYEKLRFIKDGQPPLSYYQRERSGCLTIFGEGARLFRQYLNEKGAKQ